jgi:hypothetical protein
MRCGSAPFGAFCSYSRSAVHHNSHRVLVCLDRMNRSTFRRSCAIQDEEYVIIYEHDRMSDRSLHSFDIDLPVECDDGYWDHPDPAQRLKQPPNKLISCYDIHYLHQNPPDSRAVTAHHRTLILLYSLTSLNYDDIVFNQQIQSSSRFHGE